MFRRAFVLLCIALTGCATPYQPIGFRGGYADYQLSEDLFSISFKGNGHTSSERTEMFAIRRAAEIALNNGFPYFLIVSGGTGSQTSYFQNSNTQSQARVNAYSYGRYGSAYGTGSSNTSSYAVPVTKYGTQFQIKCFKSKPESEFAAIIDAKLFLNKNFPGALAMPIDTQQR